MLNNKYIVILFICLGNILNAQNQINHVYSKYGFGSIIEDGNVRNNSMGGTGVASPNVHNINILNPALLTYNQAASFEFLISNNYTRSTNQNNTLAANNEIGIPSLRFALPIMLNKWHSSISFKKYTDINYQSTEINPIGVTSDSLYSHAIDAGNGGINEISWKNGFKINNSLRIGTEFSYYFGRKISHNVSLLSSSTNASNYDFTNFTINSIGNFLNQSQVFYLNENIAYKGLSSSIGASYYKKNDSLPFDLILGGTYTLTSNKINVNSNNTLQLYNQNSAVIDSTISNSNGTITLPKGFVAGVTIAFKDSLNENTNRFITFDYSSKNIQLVTGAKINRTKYAIGYEKMPKDGSGKFFQRIQYRSGAYFKKNADLYNEQGIDEFGITFGIGIPKRVRGKANLPYRSMYDLGLSVGSRGKKSDGLINETFIKLNLGITFNDKWFQKFRIN